MDPCAKLIFPFILRRSSLVLTLFEWPSLIFLLASDIDPAPRVTTQSAPSLLISLIVSTTSSRSLAH
jgi:hypothetical protein